MLDKKEAMARLDAIEAEAKKLREIIEAPEKWVPKKPTLCYRWDGPERPEFCRIAIIIEEDSNGYYDGRTHWEHAVPLTRAEALAMVDEPSRYPWDKAPHWAKYAATDANGDMHWFSCMPALSEYYQGWRSRPGVYELIVPTCGEASDWKNSVERRP